MPCDGSQAPKSYRTSNSRQFLKQGFVVPKKLRTKSDEELRQLQKHAAVSWPDTKAEAHNEDIHIEDGILLRLNRVLVPREMNTITELMHAVHVGKDKMKERPRGLVWPGVNAGLAEQHCRPQ